MFWQSGDRVFLVHTRQWARFGRYLDGDMAMVTTEDDTDEIPVHLDDLHYREPEPAHDAGEDAAGGLNLPPSPTKDVPRPSGTGVFLALTADPVDQPLRSCRIYLWNDSKDTLTFQAELRRKTRPDVAGEGRIGPGEWVLWAEFPVDEFHHQPSARVLSWRQGHLKQESRPEFEILFRPKHLIIRDREADPLPFPATLFQLPEDPDVRPAALPVHVRRSNPTPARGTRIGHVPKPDERAAFPDQLDLHADALFKDPAKVPEAEIFRTQMSQFESYLQKAIRLGLPRVFIIHGHGTGRLKKAIADRRRDYPEVRGVRNDHHPSFGFGASEIILDGPGS